MKNAERTGPRRYRFSLMDMSGSQTNEHRWGHKIPQLQMIINLLGKKKKFTQMGTRIVLLLSILCSAISASRGQSVDEIVAKSLNAIGGEEKWRNINSVRWEATVTIN